MNKRNRNNTSPITEYQPKPKKFSIRVMGAKSLEDIAALIEKTNDSINNTLNTKHDDLSNKIETLSNNMDGRMALVEDKCLQVETRVNAIEDAMERMYKSCDLRIAGVPHVQGENLTDVFIKLSTALQFKLNSPDLYPTLRRLLPRNVDTIKGSTAPNSNSTNDKSNGGTGASHSSNTKQTPNRTPMILARFIAPNHKIDFLNAYLKNIGSKNKASPIKASHIGFEQNSRIFVNENLTKSNKILFDEAMLLRKDNKLNQVFTINGTVHVRVAVGLRAIPVKSVDDISSAINNKAQSN